MSTRWASWVIAAAMLLASPLPAASKAGASPAFDAMLLQAEQVRSSDPAQFERLLGELNASVDAASDTQREHLAYLKAYHLSYTGRFDLGIKAARGIFESTSDPTLKLRAGSLVVNSYAATREFTEGLRFLDQTLPLIPQVTDAEVRHHAWTAAAVIYNQVGQYDLGRHYAELVLADGATPRTACITGYARLEALFNLGRLDSEEQSTNALVEQCRVAGEPLAGFFLESYRARFWASQEDRIRAIGILEQMLPAVEATNYARLIGEVHSLLAEWKLAEGMLDQAQRHAEIAIDRSEGTVHSLPLVNARRALYEIASKRGDTAAALGALRDYTDADRAYLDSVKTRELAFQMVKHETQQKNQTIELLNRENQVLTLEQQVNAKTTQANRLLIALLAVLLASIGYWAFKVKRMQVLFRKLAETDALTGISNRHHFTRRATAVLEQCRKSNQQVGLVMVDLDHFKTINDRFGHAVGDWALKAVASACQSVCRRDDLLGRLGGEEFAFLLVGCDAEASVALADECRRRIAAIDTLPSGQRFQITASFGVAGTRNCGHGFDALLAKADDALYLSKRDGRDRVSVQDATGEPQAALSG
jgi:diguanylate cyclase (GGDEF)-like protein